MLSLVVRPYAQEALSEPAPAGGIYVDDVLFASEAEQVPLTEDVLTDESLWTLDPEMEIYPDEPTPAVDPDSRGMPEMPEGAMPVSARPTARPGGGINVTAYEEVLKENLALQREIDKIETAADAAVADKRMLEEEMLELERQVAEYAILIQRLKQDGGAASPDLDRLMELESLVSQLDSDKASLRRELAALQQQVATKSAVPSPAVDSDLFRALQEENAGLKRQLAESGSEKERVLQDRAQLAAVQNDRDRELARARQTEEALRTELRKAAKEQDDCKQTLEKLLKIVPDMERELAELREQVAMKDREVASHDREMEALRVEMDRREHRIIKAERMNALMEKTRAEVQETNSKDRRDLHFNMASVYAKEGRYVEAEAEYLKALRVDPTDAGTHYNLAILYDDILNNSRKAAMHYRAYIKLAPNAKDVDEVKSWLIGLEMD